MVEPREKERTTNEKERGPVNAQVSTLLTPLESEKKLELGKQ